MWEAVSIHSVATKTATGAPFKRHFGMEKALLLLKFWSGRSLTIDNSSETPTFSVRSFGPAHLSFSNIQNPPFLCWASWMWLKNSILSLQPWTGLRVDSMTHYSVITPFCLDSSCPSLFKVIKCPTSTQKMTNPSYPKFQSNLKWLIGVLQRFKSDIGVAKELGILNDNIWKRKKTTWRLLLHLL